MQELILHERFEIEVLEVLNSEKLLNPLLFGGGTMLRLCHGLNRYSVDMDFYFAKRTPRKEFHKKMIECLSKDYEITDAAEKYFTLLYEMRSRDYPRRLKIEIRKQPRPFKYEETIAFSPHSTKQILLKSLTLEQMMLNKITAALDRTEPRDFFDMEFLIRKGVKVKAPKPTIEKLRSRVLGLKIKDIKRGLAPLLSTKDRNYYVRNGFKFLLSNLPNLIS